MKRRRPRTDWTANALRAGSFSAAALLGAGFLIDLVVAGDAGRIVAMSGVLVLLATPPTALATTFLELRPVQPRAAFLALVVLAVIGVATILAALNS